MTDHIKLIARERRGRGILLSGALIIALIAAARTLVRGGKLMLFRYNLGVSIADAGILYDFQTVMLVLVGLIVLSATLLIYIYIYDLKTPKWENFFALFAFLFGALYLFAITPLSVPDEVTHFQAVFELTNKLLGTQGDAALIDFTGFKSQLNVCTGYLRIVRELFGAPVPSAPVDAAVEVMGGMWTLTYSLEYAPQVIGYALARLLRANAVTAFMTARLFNLIFYVACVYWAIRLAPRFKVTLGLAALVPMALQQAASLSYDNFINALSLVLIASLLRAIFSEGAITPGELFPIFLSGALLAPAKGVYSFFIILFLFIPRARFQGRVKRWGCFALLLGLCAAVFAIVSVPSLIRIMSSTPPSFGAEGGTQYTLSFFFTNPGDALGIFSDSFNLYFSTWLTQAVGSSLSTCNLDLPSWLVPVYLALLALSAQAQADDAAPLPRGMRAALCGIIFAVILAFMMTMFLTWIRATDKIIIGVQGRYFTPLLALGAIALNNRVLTLKRDIGAQLSLIAILLIARSVLAIVDYTLFSVLA